MPTHESDPAFAAVVAMQRNTGHVLPWLCVRSCAISNLTLAIDAELLREARIKALKEDTSVNEICRRAIEQYVGRQSAGERHVALLRATFALAKPRPAGAEPLWPGREAIHAERLDELDRRRRR